MVNVFIALGTNLGDRAANLSAARQALAPDVQVLAVSPIYETPPWGVTDQPAFLNQVVHTQTGLAPRRLLDLLKRLESELGRVPGVRYGPRQIDLDILFYGDQTLDEPGLTIPHPRLHERAFVLVPLADLAPNLRHPVTGETVVEMLGKVDRSGIRAFRDDHR
jgi:2-amino-4-hydroxy-6-hydroxymethyldihydropteridine diphosphokinase